MNPRNYTPTQRRNGGLKRYYTAKIHPVYKILLPNDDDGTNLFPSTYHHGVAGGRANALKARHDKNGRFIKCQENLSEQDTQSNS